MFKIIIKKLLFSLFYVGFFFLIMLVANNLLISVINALGAFNYLLILLIICLVGFASYKIRVNQSDKRREYLSGVTENRFTLGTQSNEILKSRDYISELIVCGIWLIPITVYALSITKNIASPVIVALMFFILCELVFAVADLTVWILVRKNWFKEKIR